MTASSSQAVTNVRGVTGRLAASDDPDASGSDVPVHLDDGQTVHLPRRLLARQPESSCRFEAAFSDFAEETVREAYGKVVERKTLPLVERRSTRAQRKKRETGRVRIRKHVHEHPETVDEPLLREEADVERTSA